MELTTLSLALECPICQAGFTAEQVDASRLPARQRVRSDFYEDRGVRYQALTIPQCPYCLFAGPKPWFDRGADDWSDEVRAFVRDEIAPGLSAESMTGAGKYEIAMRIAIFEGMPAYEIALFAARAAWCCVDEGDTEAERYYQRFAARWLMKAIGGTGMGSDHKGSLPEPDRALYTYLVGELWRRIGEMALAATWFARVEREIYEPAAQDYLRQLTRSQQRAPGEWYSVQVPETPVRKARSRGQATT